MRRTLPLIFAVGFGGATLLGLLAIPALERVLLSWAAFLVALALVLGVLNLLAIHLRRLPRNGYSAILVLSMLLVFALGITDGIGVTDDGLQTLFVNVQQPLEAALGGLLAFFLLFAGVRLLQRQQNGWGVLFLVSTLVVLVLRAPLPAGLARQLEPLRNVVENVLVMAGMRGLLLGIALGTILLAIRILTGQERPYSE
jgi:hypothetical protein